MRFRKSKLFNKILIALGACVFALSCLVLPTFAYTLEENGNIKSENLLDHNDYYSKSNSVTIQSDSITFNVSAPIVMQFYNSSMVFVEEFLPITSNGLKSASFTMDSNYYYLRIKSNYDNREIFYNVNYLTNDSDYTISCVCTNFDTLGVLTNIMLNSGTSVLDYEPYGTWYSQQNYDNGVNDAVVDYQSSLTYYSLSPFTSSIRLLVSDNGVDNWTTLSASSYLSYSLVDNYYQLNFYGLTSNKHYRIVFDLSTEQYLDYMYFSNAVFEKVLLNGNAYILTNLNYNGQYYWFENLTLLDSPVTSYGFQFLATSATYSKTYQAKGVNISVLNTSESYNNGFENGVNSQQPVIDDLQSQINSLNYRITSLLGELHAAQDTQARSLFWTIATTPFESFKTIWDVNVWGLNIGGIIIGGFMALLIVYLIKKVWK